MKFLSIMTNIRPHNIQYRGESFAGFGGRLGLARKDGKDADSLFPVMCDIHVADAVRNRYIKATGTETLPASDSVVAPKLLKKISKQQACQRLWYNTKIDYLA